MAETKYRQPGSVDIEIDNLKESLKRSTQKDVRVNNLENFLKLGEAESGMPYRTFLLPVPYCGGLIADFRIQVPGRPGILHSESISLCTLLGYVQGDQSTITPGIFEEADKMWLKIRELNSETARDYKKSVKKYRANNRAR